MQDKAVVVYIIYFYLFLLTAWSGRAEHVTGSIGDTITLPCDYIVHKGLYAMCWGRGGCSGSHCNQIIIQTDGSRVTRRKSNRYQLLGDITQGNVSLTITKVTEKDKGRYCCRVEVTGLFNDLKGNIDVHINKKKEDPKCITEQVTTRREDVPSTGDSISSIFTTFPVEEKHHITKESEELQGSPNILVVCGVITLVVFILLMSLIIYRWKFYKATKTKTDSKSSVINMEALESVGNQATDNIYT